MLPMLPMLPPHFLSPSRTQGGRSLLPVLLLCLGLALTACASRAPTRPIPPAQTGEVRDLSTYPQDLQVYARAAGNDTPLLDSATQARADAAFNERLFHPWAREESAYTPRKFKKLIGKDWGYTGAQRWTREAWADVVANINAAAFPTLLGPGILVRNSHLREAPTMTPRYGRPTPNPTIDPFDNMQYSLLPVGMPVFVSHISRDRRWYFAETALVSGWLRAEDVALVDTTFMARYRTGAYAAIIKDDVTLGDITEHADIGTVLPLAGPGLTVFVPRRDAQGRGVLHTVTLKAAEAARKPLPLTARRIALIGNEMIGQPYGWGGTGGERDCSSTTHDLFTPFGIWLPRNSAAQARAGVATPLDGLDATGKEQLLAQNGKPFLTLVNMRGHVGVYLGQHKGKAAMFHNIWGVRVLWGGNGRERHVIGRCVVTGLAPGQELPNADRDKPLVNRVYGFTTLPRD